MNTTSTNATALRTVSGATFDSEVLTASHQQTVVVDFSAEWCGPCRMLAPVLGALAAEPDLNATIVTVDADTHPDLLARYSIRGLPTLLFFRRGQVVDQLVGLTSGATVRGKIHAIAAR